MSREQNPIENQLYIAEDSDSDLSLAPIAGNGWNGEQDGLMYDVNVLVLILKN